MPRGVTWQERAAALGRHLPPAALHPGVRAWLDGARRGKIGVALSGGSDSVALALLIWAHFPKRRRQLVALHFNHRLRGAASDRDQAFCRELAAGLGVEFATDRWAAPPRAAGEATARAARFAFFEQVIRRRRISALVLGHQQDDVAETLLMRLARGSSGGGLAAPRPVHRFDSGRVHLRPLLGLKKAQIEAALTAEAIAWRTDATNATGTFFRNRVRSEVIPAWTRAAGRDAVSGAALSRERLEEDDVALEGWVDRLDLFTGGGALRLKVLAGAPKAVVRRALHRWIARQPEGSEISRQAFEVLLSAILVGRPTRHSLGRQGFAVIRQGRLNYVLGPI